MWDEDESIALDSTGAIPPRAAATSREQGDANLDAAETLDIPAV